PDAAAEVAAPEDGGLADEILPQQGAVAVPPQRAPLVAGDRSADDAAFGVDNLVASHEPLCRRILAKSVRDGGEGAGRIEVVGVEPGDDVAARHFHSFVDRVGLAAIRPADPADARVARERSEELDRAVGASAVDDDPFEVEVAGLRKDAPAGLFEVAPAVEGRGDDAELHAGGPAGLATGAARVARYSCHTFPRRSATGAP